MEPQLLLAVSWLSGRTGSIGRVQWQVHVQSICVARRLLRDVAHPHSQNLSKFLSTGQTLAVHRNSPRPRPAMSNQNGSAALMQRSTATSAFLQETLAGLSKSPRQLLCKFFYDEVGAKLFQNICELPEYYITRTELGILRLHGVEMAAALGPNIELIGLGTGAGTKTRILLEELRDPAV